MKICFKCKECLSVTEFTKCSKSKDGLFAYCKDCYKAWRQGRKQTKQKRIGDPYQNISIKKCRWCEEELPSDKFNKDANASDGLSPFCRQCGKIYNTTLRRKRGVKPFKGQTDLAAFGKKRCKKCLVIKSIAVFSKRRVRDDGLSVLCKDCDAEYAASRTEILSIASTEYRKKLKRNPKSISYWRLRVRAKSNKGIDPYALKEKYYKNPCCAYCEIGFAHPDEMWLDHIKPRAVGGVSAIHNIEISCPTCNRMKGDLHREQFEKLLYSHAVRVLKKYQSRELIVKERIS